MDHNAPTPGRPGAGPTLSAHVPAVKRAASLLAAVVVLGLAGCGGGPALQPETPGGAGPIVQELPGLRVSVAADAWQGSPRSLPEHVLPFLVSLRNTGTRPVTISRGDFVLLDDADRQYFPLPPAEVVALLGGGSSGLAVSPSIGIGGSTGGGGTIFGGGLGISLGGGYGRNVRDVIPRALAEGPIQPGAEVTGFLYFPRPAAGYELIRVVVAPQDLPDKPRLDFHFRKVK